ncbi:unnamed protein product [Owenia fusiformis]|uniref:Uncharacterized protein n=1 Tax=Owenia fusiformis TaxID=6347 RepID=A0A8J1UE00_OWEFU|nr:unnamed protein product [Owenia fusiformis]
MTTTGNTTAGFYNATGNKTSILSAAVGIWPLNGFYGADDISGYNKTVNAVGVSFANGPNGNPQGAVSFSGSSSSYIEILHTTGSHLDVRYSFTWSAFVYASVLDLCPLFMYVPPEEDVFSTYIWLTANGRFEAGLFKRNGEGLFPSAISNETIRQNVWYYLSVVYEYNTGLLTLVQDGDVVNEVTYSPRTEIATMSKIRIGARVETDNRAFNGRMSCVQLYNKALSIKDILNAKDISGFGCHF